MCLYKFRVKYAFCVTLHRSVGIRDVRKEMENVNTIENIDGSLQTHPKYVKIRKSQIPYYVTSLKKMQLNDLETERLIDFFCK